MACRNHEHAENAESRYIQAYNHQVAGHSSMMQYNANVVCKTLNKREHNLYLTMPVPIMPYTAKYIGTAILEYREENEDGGLVIVDENKCNSPSTNTRTPLVNDEASFMPKECSKIPLERKQRNCDHIAAADESMRSNDMTEKNSNAWRDEPEVKEEDHNVDSVTGHTCSGKLTSKLDNTELISSAPSLRNHTPVCKVLHKTIGSIKKCDSKLHHFILLENLLSDCKLPCVIDLKMGTRGYGDDAPEYKVVHHTNRYLATTSSRLGVRLCGMKVYKKLQGRYVHYDRVFGRTVTESAFPDLFHEYLQDGHPVAVKLVPSIVDRLRHLRHVLTDLNSYRFYSGSLLIIYDAAELSLAPLDAGSADEEATPGRDAAQQAATPVGTKNSESVLSCDEERSSKKIKTDCERTNRHVDVRMIDFAHTTYAGFNGDKVVHSGPDNGYLKGLDTLISIFDNLKANISP